MAGYLPHLLRAAFLAIADRSLAVSFAARAGPPLIPPLRPRATAAGFLPSSVLTSSTSPVAIAAMRWASWLGSRGRFGLVMRRV